VRKADDLPPSWCQTSGKSGALTYPEPLEPPWLVAGDLYLYITRGPRKTKETSAMKDKLPSEQQ